MYLFHKMKLSSLRKKVQEYYDARESGNARDLEKEKAALRELAAFYDAHVCDKHFPHAEVLAEESYRSAAILGCRESQYQLGKRFLDMGRLYGDIQTSMLGCPQQKNIADYYFGESFTYLSEAADNGHALAYRLHGMAYVKGWGVDVDLDKGFGMVIESINRENAWDRATKIFEEWGLNSPAFFAALQSRKT